VWIRESIVCNTKLATLWRDISTTWRRKHDSHAESNRRTEHWNMYRWARNDDTSWVTLWGRLQQPDTTAVNWAMIYYRLINQSIYTTVRLIHLEEDFMQSARSVAMCFELARVRQSNYSWLSRLYVRVLGCQKITNDGLTRSGSGQQYPYGNSGCQRVKHGFVLGLCSLYHWSDLWSWHHATIWLRSWSRC